jgi:hypothetical protein
MEFLMDNIMWFIGGALVVVLAIIGFYAEKKNFGKLKNSNEKKEPINNEIKKEIVQSNTETKEEVAQSNDEVKEEVVENAPLKTDDVIEENNINKDINDNQEVVSEEKEVIDNDIKIEEPSETEILSKVAKEEIISEEAIEEENKEEETKEIKEEVVENQITDSVDEIGIKEEEELPVTIEETIDDVKNNSNSENSGINEVSLEEIEEVSIKKENEPEKVPEKKSLFGLSKKTKDEVVEEPTKEEIEEATKEDQGIPEDDDVWKF